MRILKNSFKRLRLFNNSSWLIAFFAVVFNFTLLKDHGFRQKYLDFVVNIQYGDYLSQKWFLVIVSFVILIGWATTKHTLWRSIRSLTPYFLVIIFVTFLAHWFSFYRWFDFDDYRLIGHHNFVVGTVQQNQMGMSSTSYGIAFPYLVVRWFGTSYELYNALGLFVYALSGIIIFLFADKLQKNRTISLLVALFFVTVPTYWRQTLMMQEILADGFSFFLFVMAAWLLISGFYTGSFLFTASALEFGLARTHFIAIPLILMGLLFAPRNTGKQRLRLIVNLVSFPVLTLLFLPVLRSKPPDVIDYDNLFNNWPQLVRFADTFFGVMIPHGFAYPLIVFLKGLTSYPFISSLFGLLLIGGLGIFSIWLFKRRQFLAAKLIGVGLVGAIAGSVMPTLSGIRLIHVLESLSNQYDDVFPASPTSYGVISAFGLTLIVLGFGCAVTLRRFKMLLLIVLVINVITLIRADREWAEQYSRPVRASNSQLEEIIPADGKIKVVYTPPPSRVLSRYVSYFYQLYRIREPLYFQNDPEEFIKLLAEYNPEKNSVFLLTQDDKTYRIDDHSDLVRSVYPGKITPEYLKSLKFQ